MAYPDPVSVTIGGSAISLNKQGGINPSVFDSSDHFVQTSISHRKLRNGRFQHEVRLDHAKVVADPITGLNTRQGASVRCVIDMPGNGTYTSVQASDLILAVAKFLNLDGASPTQAYALKLVNGES